MNDGPGHETPSLLRHLSVCFTARHSKNVSTHFSKKGSTHGGGEGAVCVCVFTGDTTLAGRANRSAAT